MLKFITRFRRATDGLAAIEFALIIPVMLVTFFGVSEIANYILAARKVSNITSTAADLVAQDKVIDDDEIADIFGALAVILRPFNVSQSTIRISSVVADNTGKLTIDWSDAQRTAPYAAGQDAPSTVPAGIVPNNQGVVMAEVTFTYQTLFGMFLNDGITVSDTFYLKPRRSTTVERE